MIIFFLVTFCLVLAACEPEIPGAGKEVFDNSKDIKNSKYSEVPKGYSLPHDVKVEDVTEFKKLSDNTMMVSDDKKDYLFIDKAQFSFNKKGVSESYFVDKTNGKMIFIGKEGRNKFKKAFSEEINIYHEQGFILLEQGLRKGSYKLVGTNKVYVPFYHCTFFNADKSIIDDLVADSSVVINGSELKASYYLRSPSFNYDSYSCSDPLVDEETPVVGYINQDGAAGTQTTEFLTFIQNNSIKNFTWVNVGAKWSNISSYDSLVDVYWNGGKFASTTGSERLQLNQTTRGFINGLRNNMQVHMGFCNTTDGFAGGSVNLRINTLPVFNTTNGMSLGSNQMTTGFKDFPGCDNGAINTDYSLWATNNTPSDEIGAGVFESGTTFSGFYTTQSRFVNMPFEERLFQTGNGITTLAKNLAIYALKWVIEPLENNNPTTPTNLTIGGSEDFNNTFSGTQALNCSGSTDADNDTITYVIEKGSTTTIFSATTSYVTQDSDTGNDTIVASAENCGSECKEDLFDRNTGTKWLAFFNYGWINVQLGNGAKRTLSYNITSGNDADGRDPDDWTIWGSNDNSTWTLLDNKTSQATTFASRSTTYAFTMSQPDNNTYEYYKWNITAVRTPGGNILQVSELWLIESEEVNTINYSIIGNHTEGNTYSWDLSSETPGVNYSSFRCRAIDVNGSGSYSDYYTIATNFTVGTPSAGPNITSAIINSTLGTNTTDEDLNVYYSAINNNNTVTDWRVDGYSFARFNTPFLINETTSTDYSTNGFTGTITGATWNSERNGSMSFDGTNKIQGTYSGGTSTFTVSAWVKTSSSKTTNGVAGFTDASGFRREIYLANGYLRVFVPGGYYTNSATLLNDGSWHHILGGYDGTSYFMYADNVSLTGTLISYTSTQNTNQFRIGTIMFASETSSNRFDGLIDDVMFFNKSLSEEQISNIYADGLLNKTMHTISSAETSTGEVWESNVTVSNFTHTAFLLSNNLTIVSGDQCTYVSGDWVVDCSYNCNITSNIDVGGNNISITGSGTFKTTANITGYTNLKIEGTDSSNRCVVTCEGGCFKQ